MKNIQPKSILISRTDSIGDVMLTLPICAWIKSKFPESKIIFLGKNYTQPIINRYQCIDAFENWDDYTSLSDDEKTKKMSALNVDCIIHVFPNKEIARLAKKCKIVNRIGTSHRLFHLLTCNARVNFTRKNSELHESQLNHELLRPLGLEKIPSMEAINDTTVHFQKKQVDLPLKFNAIDNYVVLHPKSQGSAKEWPIEKYFQLAIELAQQDYLVLFTGTEKEGLLFRDNIPQKDGIIDTTGQLTLDQLIKLIANAKGFVSCSTGPLHIAGYMGVQAIGLFSPKKPIHPGRWKSLGKYVNILVLDEKCPACKAGKDCYCIEDISIEKVLTALLNK